ncbi:peroxidase 2-like [Oryza brachyantha]|nr:peroxidase 2-like [Oryza brachyantha]AHW98485.1 peroxidase [Oryza brachyantha]
MKATHAGAVAGAVVVCLCAVVAVQVQAAVAGGDGVEGTVRTLVEAAIKGDPRLGPALLRLVFHDCWVNGCDGSVLLDTTPFNGSSGTEKAAGRNIGLAGFEVIDTIKAKLGDTVSCADIVVLAGRDAAAVMSRGKINYTVVTGRRDGVVSSAAAAAATLPDSVFKIGQLKDNFAAKNFTAEELVVLSGAHAVGVSHLSSFQDRLSSSRSVSTPITAAYKAALGKDVEAQKAVQNTTDPTEPFNIRDMDAGFRNASGFDAAGVDTAAVGVLDNSFYLANTQNMVLLRSDWELLNATDTRRKVSVLGGNATRWEMEFAAAMAKLSNLPAEGTRFEVRKSCRSINNLN